MENSQDDLAAVQGCEEGDLGCFSVKEMEKEERLKMHLRNGLAEGVGMAAAGRKKQKLQPRLEQMEVAVTGEDQSMHRLRP